MIQVNGSQILIDIEIDGQRLTEDFMKASSFEMFAFRIALTAGMAVPVVSMIIGCTDLSYLNKFKEINKARVYVGTDVNDMDSFDFEIVGRDIKTSPDENQFVLHTGGIITKGNLNSMFHKDQTDGYYEGTALECLKKAWTEEIKTDIDSNITSSEDISRKYKRNHMAQNFFFADMLSHIDIRPSFPLVTIDKKCNLVLRDFQKLKKAGYVHEFTYARHPMPEKVVSKLVKPKVADVIPYVGKPVATSYKTFSNRFCGYKQLTGTNTDTGKLSTIAMSILNDEEGWKLNTLADTLANESSLIEHKYSDTQAVNISEDTPESYWATAMHNKAHSVNMSAIQTKVTIEGKYLSNLEVLDLVKLSTLGDTKIAGLYIIEAIEFGFVEGSPFTTLVYLCRDNFNDVENSKSKELKLLDTKGLKISPSKKASIINAIRSSRRGLVHTRNILDKTYMSDFERHLISMQSATMTNFWLLGTSVDIKDNISRATSLRNTGNILMNKLIDKFVAPPVNRTFYNLLTQSATMQNLFFSLISSVLGSDLYTEFNQLVGDLIMFDQFLGNYTTTLSASSGRTAVSDSGKTQLSNRTSLQSYVSFKENADGSINYITEVQPVLRGAKVLTVEQRQEIATRITKEITELIPEAVDLPIPEILLSESDAIKPDNEIKEIIIAEIVRSLIDKGYVYDAEIVDAAIESGTTVNIVKADGTVITSTEAAKEMLSSNRLKEILAGNIPFDSVAATKVKRAVGDELKIRHWGTFISEEDLLEWIITQGFMDKYRTVNTTKRLSVKEGRRIYVALPSSEKRVKFYINSERVIMNEMELNGIGYYTANNKEIPYTIYYTTEGYNSNNVIVELRKEV